MCMVAIIVINKNNSSSGFNIVAINFAGYDFARTVTEGVSGVDVEMLLPAGADLHHYEPTPGDLRKIKDAELFIYTGGESDGWVNEVLRSLGEVKTLRMMDVVNALPEEVPPGGEGEHGDDEHEDSSEHEEYDEHVWTSFANASKIVTAISDALATEIPEEKERLTQNAKEFNDEAEKLKAKYAEMINTAKRRTVVFGDKFPILYFVKEMGLNYSAAFPGCADETEASPRTAANLVEIVKDEEIPVVFKIEMSSGDIAEVIARETGAEVLTFQTMHNISRADFDEGDTFLSIMEDNYSVLEKALN